MSVIALSKCIFQLNGVNSYFRYLAVRSFRYQAVRCFMYPVNVFLTIFQYMFTYFRHMEETYTGIGSVVYFKLAETLHLQYILCNVLSVYNQLVNHYVTRATSLSKRMQETKSSIEQMLNDLDDIIDRLHEYNTDLHNEKQIKDLLERALVERKNLQVKFESEYNILHCGSLMGKTCKGDNDCRGVGCFLQCKTSGLLWWLRSVCR